MTYARLVSGSSTRARAILTVVVCLFCTTLPAKAQAPPEFEKVGVQMHRDYLRLQPFEHLDTQSGNVILTIPMLSVPGNAGRSLAFQLTYNANIMTIDVAPWAFGLAGVPMRVDEQATPDPHPNNPITVAETWGLTPLIHMADGGSRRTMFMSDPRISTRLTVTANFWKYDRDENKLYLPDGTVYTFAPDPDGRLTEILDVYGNAVTLTWGAGTLLVAQDLGAGQTRQVEFDMNTAGLPTEMRFDTRTWTYAYSASDQELTGTTPPNGPGWAFTYAVPITPIRRLSTVTTPHGGVIEYEYSPHWLTPTDYQVLLDWRRVTDRGAASSQDWRVEYQPTLPFAYSVQTTITTPTGRRLTYVYEPVQLSNPQIDPDLLIDGHIALRETTIVVDATSIEAESEQRTYTQLPTVWWPSGTTHFDASVIAERIITRAGQPYTTTLSYGNSGPIDNFADYHQPNQVVEEGELSRTITRSYFHGATPYVRGQIAGETVTSDGQSWTRTWSYEAATGFKTGQTEFGATAPDGIPTTFARDGRGNVDTVTTATQRSTTFEYSWATVSQTETPEYTVTRSINPDSTVASETQAGRTTQYSYAAYYDGFRQTQTQRPGGTLPISTTFDPNGTWSRVTRGTAIETTTLDGFGRPVAIAMDNAAITRRTEYDAEGRVTYEGYPFTGATDIGSTLDYDALHRVVRRTNPDTSESTRTYGAGTVTITDEEDRITTQIWGAFGDPDAGALLYVTDALNQTWSYAYHALGQLFTVVAPDLTTRAWQYNAKNRLASETHPESGVTTYATYDAAGQLLQKTDANGTAFIYTYDGNDRVRTVTARNRVTTIAYEPGSDNRQSMTNGDVVTSWAYDTAGRVAQRQDVVNGVVFTSGYTYDGSDQLSAITYPWGRTIEHQRDDDGRMEKVFETAAGRDYAFGMTYHASGALATYTAGNNVATTIAYDPARYWVRSVSSGPLQLAYNDYDAVGNVWTIGDSRPGMGQALTYDVLDRLWTATTSSPVIGYAYDAHGNRQTAYANTYTYDPATLRLASQNGVPFGYDNNGNLTSAASETFTYTTQNMLASATVPGGGVVTYIYDADGSRVRRTTQTDSTYYVRGAQGELLTELKVPLTGDTTIRDYIYAGPRLVSAVAKTVTPPASNDINGTIVPNGPAVTTAMNTAGKRLLLQFTGVAGHRYRAAPWLTAGNFGCGAWLELRTAAGELVANASSSNGCSSLLLEPVILPISGTYTVVLDPVGSGTGTVVTRLYDIFGTIQADGSLNTATATAGASVLFEAQVAAGQRLSGVAVKTAGSFGCGYWIQLRSSTWVDVPVGDGYGCTSRLFVTASLTEGVYFVVLDPTGTETGTADVRLYDLVDFTSPIATDGTQVVAPLTTPGQRGLLTFTGTAGQRIAARVNTISGTWLLGSTLRIQKPDETFYPVENSGTAKFHEPVYLTMSGTHTIVPDPRYESTVTVGVRAYNVPDDVVGTLTVNAAPVPVAIPGIGQRASFTFDAVSGQQVTVRLTSNSIGQTTVKLLWPNGTTQTERTIGCACSFNLSTQTLSTTGTFTVFIDPFDTNTGSISVQVTSP